MSKGNKKVLTFWLFFIFSFLFLVFFSALPTQAEEIDVNTLKPDIVIDIGSFNSKTDFKDVTETSCAGSSNSNCVEIGWISQYISVLYTYGVGAAAILAMVMIMIGGFIWLLSAGSPDKVGKAKEFITSALAGLLLALFSFLILNTVNPKLTSLEPLSVSAITEQVAKCCRVGDSYEFQYSNTSNCPNGSAPETDTFKCLPKNRPCCCITSGYERGCTPAECTNSCYGENSGRLYISQTCAQVNGERGVQIYDGVCEAPQGSVSGKCCCANEAGFTCTPAKCTADECDGNHSSFIPEESCDDMAKRSFQNQGACTP
ncbi:MAG: hypothetical protein WCW26_05355 [Candidatus Buchananbacteria bacterium]